MSVVSRNEWLRLAGFREENKWEKKEGEEKGKVKKKKDEDWSGEEMT